MLQLLAAMRNTSKTASILLASILPQLLPAAPAAAGSESVPIVRGDEAAVKLKAWSLSIFFPYWFETPSDMH